MFCLTFKRQNKISKINICTTLITNSLTFRLYSLILKTLNVSKILFNRSECYIFNEFVLKKCLN